MLDKFCIHFVLVIKIKHSQWCGSWIQLLLGMSNDNIGYLPKLNKNFPHRVQAMTRTAPVYTVKWRSQVVRTRLGPPTPAPNAVSNSTKISQEFFFKFLLFFLNIILYKQLIMEWMNFNETNKKK